MAVNNENPFVKPMAWDGIHQKEIQISQGFRRGLLVDGCRVASRWELSVDSTGSATVTIIASATKKGVTTGWWYAGDKYEIFLVREYIREVSVISMGADPVFKVIHPPPEWQPESSMPLESLYIKVMA